MSRPSATPADRGRSLRRVVSDFAMAMLAALVAYQVRFGIPFPRYIPGGEPPDPGHYVAATPVLAVTLVAVFWVMGAYRLRRGIHSIDELFAVVTPTCVAFLIVLAENGLYRVGTFTYSRTTILYWGLATLLLVMVARYAVRRYEARLRTRGVGVERALLVGWGAAADLLVQRLRMFPEYGYHLVGILADPLDEPDVDEAPVLGRPVEIAEVLNRVPVQVAFIALPDSHPNQMLGIIECCRSRGVDVRIVPSMLELMTTRVLGDQIDDVPLLQLRHGLDIQGPKTLVKRSFDVVGAGLGLVVISPVLGLIAGLVKLTSQGPALIHQERVGMHGVPFRAHKFRSMRVDAEAVTGPVFASEDDERRTAVGRLLRRWSLDELPQLWNIVRGEMSLVGPRPERPSFVSEFAREMPRYCDRHVVRPGLAGWAQAKDLRGRTSVEERLIYDLYYIENWSLAFDIKIILLTLARVWTHKNAY